MIERDDELLTSAPTLGEVLVKPMEAGDEGLMRRYGQAIGLGASVLPFDRHAAPRLAEIRRDRSIRAPDAIQLASAAPAGTDLFVANDERLSRKNVPGDPLHPVARECDAVTKWSWRPAWRGQGRSWRGLQRRPGKRLGTRVGRARPPPPCRRVARP